MKTMVMPSTLSGPISRKSVSRQIVDRISTGIRLGNYRMGQQLLPEQKLCQQWEVSPASLRDALKELEILGLICRKPRMGTVIQRFEPALLFEQCAILLDHRPDLQKELVEMREIVEDALVPMVIANADKRDWKGMESAVEGMESCSNIGDLRKWDMEFHKCFYRATKNRFFSAMIPLLVAFFAEKDRSETKPFEKVRRYALQEHRALLQALKAGNVKLARRYIPLDLKRPSPKGEGFPLRLKAGSGRPYGPTSPPQKNTKIRWWQKFKQ